MKTIKLIFAFGFLSFTVLAGEVTIKSSIVCDMCKTTIEEGLAYEKGIKRILVDVQANTIFVKFNEEKISEEEIKKKISELGYVADNIRPVKEAYDHLHGCCKKEGVCEDE